MATGSTTPSPSRQGKQSIRDLRRQHQDRKSRRIPEDNDSVIAEHAPLPAARYPDRDIDKVLSFWKDYHEMANKTFAHLSRLSNTDTAARLPSIFQPHSPQRRSDIDVFSSTTYQSDSTQHSIPSPARRAQLYKDLGAVPQEPTIQPERSRTPTPDPKQTLHIQQNSSDEKGDSGKSKHVELNDNLQQLKDLVELSESQAVQPEKLNQDLQREERERLSPIAPRQVKEEPVRELGEIEEEETESAEKEATRERRKKNPTVKQEGFKDCGRDHRSRSDRATDRRRRRRSPSYSRERDRGRRRRDRNPVPHRKRRRESNPDLEGSPRKRIKRSPSTSDERAKPEKSNHRTRRRYDERREKDRKEKERKLKEHDQVRREEQRKEDEKRELQRQQQERRRKEEKERMHKEECERRKQEEMKRKRREETERKRKEEIERKRKEKAERERKQELERRQREEMEHERKIQGERERKQKAEADRKLKEKERRRKKEQAEKRKRKQEEARKREEEEQRIREEEEKRRREDEQRQRLEDEERRMREEEERVSREEDCKEEFEYEKQERYLSEDSDDEQGSSPPPSPRLNPTIASKNPQPEYLAMPLPDYAAEIDEPSKSLTAAAEIFQSQKKEKAARKKPVKKKRKLRDISSLEYVEEFQKFRKKKKSEFDDDEFTPEVYDQFTEHCLKELTHDIDSWREDAERPESVGQIQRQPVPGDGGFSASSDDESVDLN